MDHKKIKIDGGDKERLKALLKQAENRVDSLTDEELTQEEAALEARVRATVKASGPQPHDEGLDANWKAVQKKLNNVPASSHSEHDTKILSFDVKKSRVPWTTMGAIAAAALALFVLYPRDHRLSPGDPNSFEIKGTGDAVYPQSCDVDVRGVDQANIGASADGTAFEARIGDRFEISFKCSADGFVQVWTKTAPADEFRNIPVKANERVGLIDEQELAIFTAGPGGQVLDFAMTDKAVDASTDLLDLDAPLTQLDKVKVLWSDRVVIKGVSE